MALPPSARMARPSSTAKACGAQTTPRRWPDVCRSMLLDPRSACVIACRGNRRGSMMRMIDAAEVRRLLTFPLLVDALEAAHRRPRMEAQDTFMGSESALYFIRNAVDPGRYMASKLITSFPDNPTRGPLPAVQAVVALFDGTDGRPLAVIDGTELTYWRTAADSALGAKLLSRPDPKTMLVVGAGEMAPRL